MEKFFYFLIITITATTFNVKTFSQIDDKIKIAKDFEVEQKWDQALKIWEELEKSNSLEYKYYLNSGYCLMNLNDFNKAIPKLKKAIELNNYCIECYSYIARCYTEVNDYMQAEKYFNRAFTISDTSAILYYNQAVYFHKTGEKDKALQSFNKAIELNPTNNDFILGRASFQIASGQSYLAYSDISELIKREPANAKWYYYRAYVLNQLNLFDEALTDINKSILLNPNISDYYNMKYTILFSMGKYEEAEQTLLKSIDINPKDFNVYYGLAEVYFYMNDFDMYCNFIKKASELMPADVSLQKSEFVKSEKKYCSNTQMPYYFIRALSKYISTNYAECIEICDNGLKNTGQSPILYNLKASAHLSRNEIDSAISNFNASLKHKDKMYNEAQYYHVIKIKENDAKNVGESYIVKNYGGLAIAYLLKKEYLLAIKFVNLGINKAETLDYFDGVEILYNIKALAYIGNNELEFAKNILLTALQKNPYYFPTRLNLCITEILSACKYKPKQMKFIYSGGNFEPRLYTSKLNLIPEKSENLVKAEEYCDFVLKNEKDNLYANLLKSLIKKLKDEPDYCNFVNIVKELGYLDVEKELNVKCK